MGIMPVVFMYYKAPILQIEKHSKTALMHVYNLTILS